MPNIYTGSVQYTAVVAWAALTAYVSTSNGGRGDYRRQLATPASGSERVFRCTTSGTSLASEPAWVLTKNATTTEAAGPVWTECTGQEADQVAANWTAPHARLRNAVLATWSAAGDTFYVAHDHAATEAAALIILLPSSSTLQTKVICVNATTGSSLPPVSADLRTTGSESTTGASAMELRSGVSSNNHFIGMVFSAGSGATTAALTLSNGRYSHTFKNCTLKKLGTTANLSAFVINSGGNNSAGAVIFDNTQLVCGSTGDAISAGVVSWRWKNTPVGIGGTVFPALLIRTGNTHYDTVFNRVGLAEIGGGTLVPNSDSSGNIILEDCVIASNTIVADIANVSDGVAVYVLNTDSSGTNYRNEKHQFGASQVVDTTLIRTGGASDGTTGTSNKITATANANWATPFKSIQIPAWNDLTAVNRTVTIEGLQDPRTSTSLPTNEHVWMELSYKGSATSTLATKNEATKADILAAGTALTASTEAWGSLITARVNSTAYALGARYKVATNAGRVFICTTAGTSAAAEPAGLATAIDGGAVADGTATFTAAVRFKQSITLSAPQPAQKGYIYATIKVGRASGIYYIDPKLVLS